MNIKDIEHILSDDAMLTVLMVLTYLTPGVGALFLFSRPQFYQLDFLKLLLLCLIFPLPAFFATASTMLISFKQAGVKLEKKLGAYAILVVAFNAIVFFALAATSLFINYRLKAFTITFYL